MVTVIVSVEWSGKELIWETDLNGPYSLIYSWFFIIWSFLQDNLNLF